MKQRDFLTIVGACVLVVILSLCTHCGAEPEQNKKARVLYYTRSVSAQHSPVVLLPDGETVSGKALKRWGEKNNVEFVCEKDGTIFDGDLDQFDAFAFYTAGDLDNEESLDGSKPMSREGKAKFMEAVKKGKGFVGFHATSDSWRDVNYPPFENQEKIDPFLEMLGGEFYSHGEQQSAKMLISKPVELPCLKDKGDYFEEFEEWYCLKNFNKDMHVILTQDTTTMKNEVHNRPPHPATWARMHGRGRVAYTSLGHLDAIWENEEYINFFGDLISWALKRFDMDLTPNMDEVTPGANILLNKVPPLPPPTPIKEIVPSSQVPPGTLQTLEGKNFYYHNFRDITFKPYVDVFCTPTGRNILRDAPSDHVHHHSMMFAIRINGVNFWEESPEHSGRQELVPGTFVSSAVKLSENRIFVDDKMKLNLLTPQGAIMLKEDRIVQAKNSPKYEANLLTWTSILSHPKRDSSGIPLFTEPILLHGSAYNGFGMRFHDSMDKGGKILTNEGSLATPLSEVDQNILCNWIAYTAELEGKPVTVAIFDLKSAVVQKEALQDVADPKVQYLRVIKELPMLAYEVHDYEGVRNFAYISATININREPLELAQDQAVLLRYGVAVWEGERSSTEIEELYQNWNEKWEE